MCAEQWGRKTALEMQAKIIVLKNGTHTGQIILNCILLVFLAFSIHF